MHDLVLIGLRLPHRPPGIRTVFAWIEHLRPWSMVEIFLLGLFVAYVRLSGIAHIDLGPAIAGARDPDRDHAGRRHHAGRARGVGGAGRPQAAP